MKKILILILMLFVSSSVLVYASDFYDRMDARQQRREARYDNYLKRRDAREQQMRKDYKAMQERRDAREQQMRRDYKAFKEDVRNDSKRYDDNDYNDRKESYQERQQARHEAIRREKAFAKEQSQDFKKTIQNERKFWKSLLEEDDD